MFVSKNRFLSVFVSKRLQKHLARSKTQVVTCVTMNHGSHLEPDFRRITRTSPHIWY